MARGFALVWSGPGIRTFTATGDRPVQAHEPTLFEIWVCADGYWCDHTKNVCPGELDARVRRAARAAARGLRRSRGLATDGAWLPELDRLIRDRIAAAGYEGQPSHPVCHGVGARAHEPPYAHQAGEGTIREGMVLAIEPGVYWEGGGGLRLEDNFLITADGNEKLCSLSRTTSDEPAADTSTPPEQSCDSRRPARRDAQRRSPPAELGDGTWLRVGGVGGAVRAR